MSLASLSRQVIAVILGVALLEELRFRGATYEGLRHVLGHRTLSGVRQAVRAAREAGAIAVVHAPNGRGGKAVVRLTWPARRALELAGLTPKREEQHP